MDVVKRGSWMIVAVLFLLISLLPRSVWAEVSVGEVVTHADRVTLGASVRARYENRYNHDFDDSTPNSSDFTLLRTRVELKADVTDDVKAFVQFQDSRIFGAAQNEATNTRSVDLHQGYVDLLQFGGLSMTLRVGRQILSYGDQRLVGGLEWNNIGRAHDGIKAMINVSENFQLDLFATKVAELDNAVGEQQSITPFAPTLVGGGANVTAGADQDQNFYGAYGMWKPGDQTADFYLLYMEDNSPQVLAARGVGAGTPIALNATDDDLKIVTVGTRWKGPIADRDGLDYGFEGAYQFGDGANLDIKAFALHGEVGLAVPLFHTSRLSVEANYGSGDDNPADKDFETFSNLFPTNHLHYGYMDRIAWMNTKNYAVKLDSKISEKFNAKLHLWHFELAEGKDALFHAGAGTIFAAGAANKEEEVGEEIDLILNYKYNKAVSFEFGYSHFFIGDAVEEAKKPNEEDADFAYLQMVMKF